MQVTQLEWFVTLDVAIAVLLFDLARILRNAHEPKARESAIALCFYVGAAVAFGGWVSFQHGASRGLEFFAGWLTEYSLSVDNLFIFLIIMASFKVPRVHQQQALFIGIVLALVFRGVFIGLGAVAIARFSWVFYVFGLFLIYTAWRIYNNTQRSDDGENAVVRFARAYLNTTDRWHGMKFVVRQGTKRVLTPMAIVVVALGTTDLLFALDSIPAIYGLTEEPYLVLTANIFALMGLRQLYFLLGDLMNRLAYLSQGLGVILAFIGVKLVLHALHENEVPFVNGGHPVDVWEIPTFVGLGVIVVTLAITAIASLWKTRSADDP